MKNEISKELISVIVPEGDTTENVITHFRFSLSEDEILNIVKQKPLNCMISDEWWIYQVISFGIPHALNHLFQSYVRTLVVSGLCKQWVIPDEYRECHFGNVAREFKKSGGGTLEELKVFILKQFWPLEELGNFGKWMQEGAIDPVFMNDIIREFFDD